MKNSTYEDSFLNLYLTSSQNSVATLSLPSAAWTQTVNIPANSIVKVNIQNLLGGGAGGLFGTSTGIGFPQNNVVEDLAIHVTSDFPISIYSANEVTTTMEIYLAIPNANLGYEYISMSPEGTAQFMVYATEDNTTVNFQLPAGKNVVGHANGSTWSVTLNKGQTYTNQVNTGTGLAGDLTGTIIKADKPIGVLSGSACANFPASASKGGFASCSYCDHVIEQITPVDTWGKKFVAANFGNTNLASMAARPLSSFLRIVSSDPGVTTVNLTGIGIQTLNGIGDYKDFDISNGGVVIESDKPIAAYGITAGNTCYGDRDGDPSYIALIPVEQWGNRSLFICPEIDGKASKAGINIFAKKQNPNVSIDGTVYNNFTPIGATGFFYKQIQVSNAAHLATSTNDFMIYVYGFSVDVSYAYPAAGPSLRPLERKVDAGYIQDTVCYGEATKLTDTTYVLNTEVKTRRWEFPDGTVATTKNPTFTFDSAGYHEVKLIVTDTTNLIDTAIHNVYVRPLPEFTINYSDSICKGETVQFQANGVGVWEWSGAGLSATDISNPQATPNFTSNYTIKLTDQFGCEDDSTVKVTVVPLPNAQIDGPDEICLGFSTVLKGLGGVSYQWSPGSENTQEIEVQPNVETTYTVLVRDAFGCQNSAEHTVGLTNPPNVGPDFGGTVCSNDESFDLNEFLDENDHLEGGSWEFQTGQGNPMALDLSGELDATLLSPGNHQLWYYYDAENGCPIDTANFNLTVHLAPTGSLHPIDEVCTGQDFQIDFTIDGIDSKYNAYFEVNGNIKTEVNVVNGVNSFFYPSIADIEVKFDSIRATVAPFCYVEFEDTIEVSVVNEAPKLILKSMDCNETNTAVDVVLEYQGGDEASYEISIDGDPFFPAPVPGELELSSGNHYIKLRDVNNCVPNDSIRFMKNCNCDTDPGNMFKAGDTLAVCGPDGLVKTVHKKDEALDGNDVKSYVLHTSPNSIPGDIILRRTDAPLWEFDPALMEFDVVYYSSAIVGDDRGDGHADENAANGCTQTSPGVPIIWRKLPEATFSLTKSEICETDSFDIRFQFIEGTQPFIATFDENGSRLDSLSGLENGDTYKVKGFAEGQYVYDNFFFIDKYGCEFQMTSYANNSVVVNDSISASVDQIECSGDDKEYRVTFNLSKGTGNYLVDGDIINGSVFTSDFIDSGDEYSFDFTDDKNCNTVTITGDFTCSCRTKAPTMANTSNPQYFCEGMEANALVNYDGNGDPENYFGDINDTYSFVLCTDSASPIGTMIPGAISHEPIFDFNDFLGLVLGQEYFISPIAGDSLSGEIGIVNVAGDLCPDYYNSGTPVMWLANPSNSSSGLMDALCHGETAVVNYEVQSVRPVSFELITLSDGSSIPFTDLTSGNYSESFNITKATDAVVNEKYYLTNPSYTTNTGQTCQGTWTGDTVSYTWYDIPTLSFIGNENYTICEGEDLGIIELAFTGSETVDVVAQAPIGSFTENALNSPKDFYIANSDLESGNVNYLVLESINMTISSSQGIEKSCVGVVQEFDTIAVNLVALPSLLASVDETELCIGEQFTLSLIEPNNPSGVFYVYTDNGDIYDLPTDYQTTFTPLNDTVINFVRVENDVVSDASGNFCGQDVNESVSVDVHQLPSANIYDDGTTLCEGDPGYMVFTEVYGDNQPITINVKSEENGVVSNNSFAQFTHENAREFASSPTRDVFFTITSVVDDFGCVGNTPQDTASITVHQLPVPSIGVSLTEDCVPLETSFTNTTDPNYSASCEWNFGNGNSSSGCGVQTTLYPEDGTYTIKLIVTSNEGCVDSVTTSVTAHPIPIAGFRIEGTPDLISSTVQINDESFLADSYFYTTSYGDVSTDRVPAFELPNKDTAWHSIEQIVFSGFGCSDTISDSIFVKLAEAFYIPNAFSPNGDELNEGFGPELFGADIEFYEFGIYDRWGHELFFSRNPISKWDGKGKDFELVNAGIYTYRLRFKLNENAERQEYFGVVHLIR